MKVLNTTDLSYDTQVINVELDVDEEFDGAYDPHRVIKLDGVRYNVYGCQFWSERILGLKVKVAPPEVVVDDGTPKFAICQTWTESERGWGQRPDGYSLHLTKEDAGKFEDAYWGRQQALNPGGTPDEYTRPDQNYFVVRVSPEIFSELKNQEDNACGFRAYGKRPAPFEPNT